MEISHLCKQRFVHPLLIALGMSHSFPESCARVLADFWGVQHYLDIVMEKLGQQSLKLPIFIIRKTTLQ